jgi:hypothetical protein
VREDAVASAKGSVERLEVGGSQHQRCLHRHRRHRSGRHCLREGRGTDGAAGDEVGGLSPDESCEVGGLRVLHGLRRVANGESAVGRQLLHAALSPSDCLFVGRSTAVGRAAEQTESQIEGGRPHADPVDRCAVVGGRTGVGVGLHQPRVAEGGVRRAEGIAGVGRCHALVREHRQLRRRKAEVIQRHVEAEHRSPQLNAPHAPEGVRQQRGGGQLPPGPLRGHSGLRLLAGEGEGGEEVVGEAGVEHECAGEHAGNLQNHKRRKGHHLTHLAAQHIRQRFLNILADVPTLFDPFNDKLQIIFE